MRDSLLITSGALLLAIACGAPGEPGAGETDQTRAVSLRRRVRLVLTD